MVSLARGGALAGSATGKEIQQPTNCRGPVFAVDVSQRYAATLRLPLGKCPCATHGALAVGCPPLLQVAPRGPKASSKLI